MLFSLFHSIRSGKKGQLASLLTVVLVAVLIFAFVSVNLGKLGLNRTRLSNAADSASLAAGSVASQLLNYMASYNEMMLLNFSGFTTQILLAMIQWIMDFIFVIIYIVASFTAHPGGAVPVSEAGIQAIFALGSLWLSTMILILLIEGATKSGKSLEKRIGELNSTDKLTKNTRNSLRQYSLMNAGIDQPKIDYDDWLKQEARSDTEDNWKDYLNVETGFGKFMRLLSKINDDETISDPDIVYGADTGYGPNNRLSYSWKDSRRSQIVNNRVEVVSTPMQPLSLETKDFEDVANDSGLRSEMKNALDDVDLSWWLESFVDVGLMMSPLVYVFLDIVVQLATVTLVGLIAIFLATAVTLEIAYTATWLSCFGCCGPEAPYCCACAAYYAAFPMPGIAEFISFAIAYEITAAAIAATAMTIDPSGIPCLVYGTDSNDLTVSAEIKRTTQKADGAALDYGLWRMQYPEVKAFSKAKVSGLGGGKLFPPVTNYSPKLMEVR